MWRDLGYELPIQEGSFWLDNGIIKAFDKQTCIQLKLYTYKISDDLTISIKPHKDLQHNNKKEFETWQETVERLQEHINDLEYESISLLQRYGLTTDRKIINTNSTGKDSMVMLTLAENHV